LNCFTADFNLGNKAIKVKLTFNLAAENKSLMILSIGIDNPICCAIKTFTLIAQACESLV